jgi:hypothetical protein
MHPFSSGISGKIPSFLQLIIKYYVLKREIDQAGKQGGPTARAVDDSGPINAFQCPGIDSNQMNLS